MKTSARDGKGIQRNVCSISLLVGAVGSANVIDDGHDDGQEPDS